MASVFVVAYYAMDRQPPFEVLSVEPAFARPGDYVTVKAKVRRDVSRHCDASFSRFLYDSAGARFDIGHSITSADMIASLEARSPGALALSVLVPLAMAQGPANLQTVLAYNCNPVHAWIPIMVTTNIPFDVLPP